MQLSILSKMVILITVFFTFNLHAEKQKICPILWTGENFTFQNFDGFAQVNLPRDNVLWKLSPEQKVKLLVPLGKVAVEGLGIPESRGTTFASFFDGVFGSEANKYKGTIIETDLPIVAQTGFDFTINASQSGKVVSPEIANLKLQVVDALVNPRKKGSTQGTKPSNLPTLYFLKVRIALDGKQIFLPIVRSQGDVKLVHDGITSAANENFIYFMQREQVPKELQDLVFENKNQNFAAVVFKPIKDPIPGEPGSSEYGTTKPADGKMFISAVTPVAFDADVTRFLTSWSP